MSDGIPVFDLKQYTNGSPRERTRFQYELEEALRVFGFFKFTGHGIEPELVTASQQLAQEYFRNTPDPTKLSLVHKEQGRQRGHGELWSEHAEGSDADAEFDLKEFYSFGPDLTLHHPYANDLEENIYPPHMPDWEAAERALYREDVRVMMILLGAMSELIGMAPDFLPKMATHGDSMKRYIHYPDLEEVRRMLGGVIPTGCLRSRHHKDINLVTLLRTGKGLNVIGHNGVTVKPELQPGEMLAQTGDTYDDLSGGYFPATVHFVENLEGARFADTLFGHAEGRAVIETVKPMLPHAVRQVIPETERRKLCVRLNGIGHKVHTPRF